MDKAVTVTITGTDGKVIHKDVAAKRTFSTGSEGYGSYGKLVVGGERFQLSFNLVAIDSRKK